MKVTEPSFQIQCITEATVKAATEVAGCCENYHRDCRLLRRLPQRLQAAAKAATEGTADVDADATTEVTKITQRLRFQPFFLK